MANSYTTATTLFDIDTAVTEDGLETLKLTTLDEEDIIYIHNGATVTISNSISIEIFTFDTGHLVISACTVTCKLSSTTDIIISANDSVTITSGVLQSQGANWALVNYGTVTMDLYSYLGYAKPCLTVSSCALVWDDLPIEMEEDNPSEVAINFPLGGTKDRGKMLGFHGRKIVIQGSFLNPSNYTTHFLKLKYMASLVDTHKFTWEEGSINKAHIKLHPLVRTVNDIQERFYILEISEIY